MKIEKTDFGITKNGNLVEQYTLENGVGIEMSVITYGGRITSLKIPNKEGVQENIVLGFKKLTDYENDNPYLGAIVGRFANRIAKGQFSLSGKQYSLAVNNGENHLHGGICGFDNVLWNATPAITADSVSLKLEYLSKDGEEGYPGNLKVAVVYTLTKSNLVEVSYEAVTDKETIVNLTQHAYFNLTGDFKTSIEDHILTINSDSFLPVDSSLIPTGKIESVKHNAFDFRTSKSIRKDIGEDNEQLKLGNGYDHCYVINGKKGVFRIAATAYEQKSGRFMEVFTEEPGMQLYTGNFLDAPFAPRTGFCLETQHFPDSPNQSNFPTVTLKPGEIYKTKTSFKFSVK